MLAFIAPAIDPVAVAFGPFAVRWYGLAYFAGILLGWWYARRLVAERTAVGRQARADHPRRHRRFPPLAGGRHRARRPHRLRALLPARPFPRRSARRSSASGRAACRSTAGSPARSSPWRSSRCGSESPMLSLFDVAAASVTFGLFFGRLANFINGELWGRVTDVPWGVVFCNERSAHMASARPDLPRHPSQLYEAALEGVLLFIVLRILTHRFGSLRRPGLTGGAFIAGYGLARILVEFVREPDPQLGYLAGSLTMGMLLSLPMVLVGARRDRRGAARANRRERHAARQKAPAAHRGERADERRRLHGALPRRSGARLLHDARSVRRRTAISSPRRRSARCSARSSARG